MSTRASSPLDQRRKLKSDGWPGRRDGASTRTLLRLVLAGVSLQLAGCTTPSHAPANLSSHKREIRRYVDSGQYQKDLDEVARTAAAWIEQRAAKGGVKLTAVFDLDETLLFNWPHISEMDFGYVVREWERWMDTAKAPAIESVREVYRTARRTGVEVVFITGRPEEARGGTERNLRAIDCADYVRLIFKPRGLKTTSAAFKTDARSRLRDEGRTIIANIGDQESDLSGGFAERTFKLPNVFYMTD